ncbi:MAG TPA: DUF4397 domain-containing protein [Candidatus Krumholzibacteria bacterium]
MRTLTDSMIDRTRRALVLGVAVLAVAAAGCDDDDNPVSPPVAKANLRAIHLSPDAPEVDIYFNGNATPSVTDLAFNEGTAFLSVDAGTYDVAIAPANTSVGGAVLTVNDVDLDANKRYTAVAFSPVASIGALLLTDDLSTPPAGQIRVRAIHTASAVGQVDIWNIPAVGSPTILYENVDFGVAGGYLTIPAGAYTLGFDVNNDGTPELTFTTPSLAAGTVANIFAVSNAGSNVYLLAQLQNSQVAQINPN